MATAHRATTASASLRLEYGQCTDQGSRRRNEDAVLAFRTDDGVAVIVADGMGSGLDGQLFSQRAVERAQARLLATVDLAPRERVEQALRAAADELHLMRNGDERYSKSGSTIVLGVVTLHRSHAEVVVSGVGDSRAYIVRADGTVEQLTRDHTYRQRLLDAGIDRAAVDADPQGPLLTHVLGQKLDELVIGKATSTHTLRPGDRLVLCSDGVSKTLDPIALGRLALGRPAEAAAEALVRRAVHDKDSRGRDNATAVVVAYTPQAALAPPRPRGNRAALALLGLTLALVAAGLWLLLTTAGPPTLRATPLAPASDQTVVLPPTATPTLQPTADQSTPQLTSTPGPSITPTNTPVPPTSTPTNTPIPPTRRPPTATPQPEPPTQTAVPNEPATPEPTAAPEPAPTAPSQPEPPTQTAVPNEPATPEPTLAPDPGSPAPDPGPPTSP